VTTCGLEFFEGLGNYALQCKGIEFTEQGKTRDESRKTAAISSRAFSELPYGLWSEAFFAPRFLKQFGFGIRRANCR